MNVLLVKTSLDNLGRTFMSLGFVT